MANAAYWFKHDSNAKDDYKCMILIDQLGLEGYGIFWILIETLREQAEGRYPVAMLPILAKRYGSSTEKFRAVVTGYGLFETFEDETFANASLLRRMSDYNELRRINSLKGKRSVERRDENLLKESTAVEPRLNRGSTAVQPRFNEVRGVEGNRVEGKGLDEKGTLSLITPKKREVADYFTKNGSTVDQAGEFWHYNNAKGWMLGKEKMTDWTSAAFLWIDKKKKENNSNAYRLYSSQEVGGFKQPEWKDVQMVRIEGKSACRSAKGAILYASITDVITHNLIVAAPKIAGKDWID